MRGKIFSYADDTVLLYYGKNSHDLNTVINEDLKIVRNWFLSNKLNVNITKTKFMEFKVSNSSPFPFNLVFHENVCDALTTDCRCRPLTKVSCYKYLGLQIDSNLKWKSHIVFITRKLRYILYCFYHLRHKIHNSFFINLYYAWVHPLILYGLTVWGGYYISNLKSLILIQKRIFVFLNDVSPGLLISTNILSIRYLFFYKLCLMVYKNINQFKHKPFMNQRRPNDILIVPRPYKELYKKTFLFLAPRFFNSLSLSVQNASSDSMFKKELKLFLHQTSNIEIFFLIFFIAYIDCLSISLCDTVCL